MSVTCNGIGTSHTLAITQAKTLAPNEKAESSIGTAPYERKLTRRSVMRSTFRIGLGIIALLLAVACACPSAPSPTPVPPTEPPTAVPTEAPPPTPEPTVPPSPLRLAFIDQNHHVCTIQLDGQGLACLTDSGEDSSPAWSPDGQTLAFIHREDTPPAPGQVMLYDVANGTTSVLPLEITEEWILGTLGNLPGRPTASTYSSTMVLPRCVRPARCPYHSR